MFSTTYGRAWERTGATGGVVIGMLVKAGCITDNPGGGGGGYYV